MSWRCTKRQHRQPAFQFCVQEIWTVLMLPRWNILLDKNNRKSLHSITHHLRGHLSSGDCLARVKKENATGISYNLAFTFILAAFLMCNVATPRLFAQLQTSPQCLAWMLCECKTLTFSRSVTHEWKRHVMHQRSYTVLGGPLAHQSCIKIQKSSNVVPAFSRSHGRQSYTCWPSLALQQTNHQVQVCDMCWNQMSLKDKQ